MPSSETKLTARHQEENIESIDHALNSPAAHPDHQVVLRLQASCLGLHSRSQACRTRIPVFFSLCSCHYQYLSRV